jgi:hypothetical protein
MDSQNKGRGRMMEMSYDFYHIHNTHKETWFWDHVFCPWCHASVDYTEPHRYQDDWDKLIAPCPKTKALVLTKEGEE